MSNSVWPSEVPRVTILFSLICLLHCLIWISIQSYLSKNDTLLSPPRNRSDLLKNLEEVVNLIKIFSLILTEIVVMSPTLQILLWTHSLYRFYDPFLLKELISVDDNRPPGLESKVFPCLSQHPLFKTPGAFKLLV